MKRIIIITVLFVTTQISFAQAEFGQPNKTGEKFRQLEKIKLLEILQLDEETAVRFFTRKNAHIEKQKEVVKNHKNILDEIEESLKNETPNESELLSLIKQNEDIESKMHQRKKNFISSIKNILTTEQIAKLILFEFKFKREVRDLLIKGGKKRFKKRGLRKNNFD